jgi:PAS domain-containing protein
LTISRALAETNSATVNLIERISRSAAQRREWTGFCSALAEALGGAAVAINLEHPRPGEVGLAYSTGFDPAYRASFRTHYFALEPWEQPMSQLPVGAMGFGAHLVPERDVLRSEYYNDWMKPQGFEVGPTLGGVIGVQGVVRSYLGVYRPKGAREYGREEYTLCRMLMPHLRRAIEFDRHFRSLEIQREIALDALDHLTTGLILVDAKGRVLACNRLAEKIVAANDGLHITEDGLAGTTLLETRRLRILIHQAARGEGGRGGSLSLSRPSGEPDFEVLVSCFSHTPVQGLEGSRVAAVLVNDSSRRGVADL